MKKTSIKFVKIILPLLLGCLLIYYSYHQFSAQQRSEVFGYIRTANYGWIFLSMIIAFVSHLSRAWRWNYMLSSFGKPPQYLINIIAIGVGYAMNIFIPRSGEISRAAIVNRTDKIPMDKALGTIIAERVLDLIVLLFIMLAAFLTAGEEISMFFWGGIRSAFAKANPSQLFLYLGIIVLVLILVLIALKYLKLIHRIKNFLIGIKDGFKTIWTMEKKWWYLLHTLFIWFMYLLMFYVSIFALPGTSNIPLAAILCAFVAGSFAVAFTNGGFGAYPLFIAAVLLLFGVPETLGASFGWILWISQTLLVLAYGLLSFIMLSIKQTLDTR